LLSLLRYLLSWPAALVARRRRRQEEEALAAAAGDLTGQQPQAPPTYDSLVGDVTLTLIWIFIKRFIMQKENFIQTCKSLNTHMHSFFVFLDPGTSSQLG